MENFNKKGSFNGKIKLFPVKIGIEEEEFLPYKDFENKKLWVKLRNKKWKEE